jgi:hypothetical protein
MDRGFCTHFFTRFQQLEALPSPNDRRRKDLSRAKPIPSRPVGIVALLGVISLKIGAQTP